MILFKCLYDVNSTHEQKYISIINYASKIVRYYLASFEMKQL